MNSEPEESSRKIVLYFLSKGRGAVSVFALQVHGLRHKMCHQRSGLLWCMYSGKRNYHLSRASSTIKRGKWLWGLFLLTRGKQII